MFAEEKSRGLSSIDFTAMSNVLNFNDMGVYDSVDDPVVAHS
jgi:hypothetical protein